MFWHGGIKMRAYFSAKQMSFIPKEWKDDGTYTDETWPSDAILLDESHLSEFWKRPAPAGYMLGATTKGLPTWVEVPPAEPLSASEIEASRLRAYADPIAGSDRLFSESTRMQIMGENGHEEVRARAIARFEEIQAQYPWPAK